MTWVIVSALPFSAFAQAPSNGAKNGSHPPDEEEIGNGTPFTEYGEFNEEADEEADTQFFQHGRFFGVCLGLGYESVSGNRGALWQGGFPVFDFKLQYWF